MYHTHKEETKYLHDGAKVAGSRNLWEQQTVQEPPGGCAFWVWGVRPPNTGQSESEVKVSVTQSCLTLRHWPDSWKTSSQWSWHPRGGLFSGLRVERAFGGQKDPQEQALPISLGQSPLSSWLMDGWGFWKVLRPRSSRAASV